MVHHRSFRVDRRRLLGAVAGGAVGAARVRGLRGERGDEATPGTPVPEALGGLAVVRHPVPPDPGSPVDGGELRLLVGGAPSADFQPVALRQDSTITVGYLDPLLAVDPVEMTPRPWLAESWTWNKDRTEITYRLRDDVTWHDGSPLTAEDVRFSLLVGRDDVDSALANFYVFLRTAEALDDRTIRVTLAEPDVNWLLNASTQPVFQRAQYAEYWESKPEGERTLTGFDWSASPPVGTGPWRVAAVEGDGSRIALSRNDAYFAGPPHFATLTVTAEPDSAERVAAWRAGEGDLLSPVAPADLEPLGEIPGTLHVADAASVMFAAFNFFNPVRALPELLVDLRLRQALSLALDRSGYAEDVFAGFLRADRAGTVAQPWANEPEVSTPKRDRRAARELLLEAGVQDLDGDGLGEDPYGVPLVLVAIHREDARPELAATLARVVADLAEVGVALEVQALPPDAFAERTQQTFDFDLVAYAYDLFPGFTDFDLYGSAWSIRRNPQGWNPGGYWNPEVERAIADFFAADPEDLDGQRDALARLQIATDDDLFGLWLGFPKALVLARPDIRGFAPSVLWPITDTRSLWRE
jgi:peptide/nickel transport system substrate-binding protein